MSPRLPIARASAIVAALLVWPLNVRAEVIYVKHDAAGANDGASWTDAYRDLQDALGSAAAGDQIWVATGAYRPTDDPNGDPRISFELVSGVGLYGGFAGGETDVSQRNPLTNPTVLTGDLADDDTPDFGNRDENSFQVVTSFWCNKNTILDGFVIQGGAGDGPDPDYDRGGGVYLEGGRPRVANCWFAGNRAFYGGGLYVNGSDPTIVECRFERNEGIAGGGGAYFFNSAAAVSGCVFFENQTPSGSGGGVVLFNGDVTISGSDLSGNLAAGAGGGLYALGDSALVLVDSMIRFNFASSGGGGMYVYASPVRVVRCTFEQNAALSSGGGVSEHNPTGGGAYVGCTFYSNSARNAGGMAITSGTATVVGGFFVSNGASDSAGAVLVGGGAPLLVNCVLTGNTATTYGAGVLVYPSYTATLTNCSFFENAAVLNGGGVYTWSNGLATLNNCILWDDQPNEYAGDPPYADHSIIEGSLAEIVGDGNLNTNPLYVDPDGPDDGIGTLDDDLSVQPNSPAVDSGNNDLLPADLFDLDEDGDTSEDVALDVTSHFRRYDAIVFDTGFPPFDAPYADRGAYEFGSPPFCPGDTNLDGRVDNEDLQRVLDAWARSIGEPGYDAAADFNHDGQVENADLQTLLEHWAAVCQ